jgi:hypothetical protein
MSTPLSEPPRRLALATAAAALVAAMVLVVAVLPAEYGIDPTGVGRAIGLVALDGSADEEVAAETPEATTAPTSLRTFESRFPRETRQVLSEEGYLPEGDSVFIPFTLSTPNLTKVTMRLEFVDSNTSADGRSTRPDTFEIELKAPNGDVTGGVVLRSEDNTGGGHGSAVFVVREAPYPRAFEAASEADARAAFAGNDPPDMRQMGGWTARIKMVEAQDADVQGASLPGVPGTPATSDDGNTWKMTLHAESYSLEVEPRPGSERRADKVTLEIPAGGELEYKLAMTLGARLDHAWATDGPEVYVDFHGERTGDASGAFTRHKSGYFTSDAGTLVAPFDGRHGWYWRNAGETPVTIVLETRGQYEVIGRV